MCVKSPPAVTELTPVCTFQTWERHSLMSALWAPALGTAWGLLLPMAVIGDKCLFPIQ